jgi:hypothetical protein
MASGPASRNDVGTAICLTRPYREVICLSVGQGQRPPGFGVGPLYCEFRAIIVGRPTSGTCAACNLRQCFEGLVPILGLSALSVPNQQFQLASRCWPLLGHHTKHNSFSWDSKLLRTKYWTMDGTSPTHKSFAHPAPALQFGFMISGEHRLSRRNVTRYSQRRSNPYGNPKRASGGVVRIPHARAKSW